MSKEKFITIPKSGLKLEIPKGSLFTGIQKDVDDIKRHMYYVILVLLVMVAGMIIGLLTAIWQSRQNNEINIILDKPSHFQEYRKF